MGVRSPRPEYSERAQGVSLVFDDLALHTDAPGDAGYEDPDLDAGEVRYFDKNEVRNPEQPSLDRAVFGDPEVLIPGMGNAHHRCGQWVPRSFCDGEDPHVAFGEHLCGRRECPRCWSSQWLGPRTASVVSRLSAGRWAEPDGPGRRVLHTTASPPEGSISNVQELFERRSDAIDIVKERGVRGGVVIPHAYRATGETKARFAEAKQDGFDGGLWRFIRENDRYWYAQVKWSPHYHVVGLCRDLDGREDPDGWVVKNHSTGKGTEPNPGVDRTFSRMENLHDADPYEDLIKAIRYLGSHTVARDGRQSVTWFGSLHGTNLDPDEALSDGAWSVIQRRVEELVGAPNDRSAEGGEDADAEESCPVDGCDGQLHPIWEVPDYIEQRADLEMEAVVRLRTAYDWVIDNVDEMPRGGWPTPTTRDEARTVFEEML